MSGALHILPCPAPAGSGAIHGETGEIAARDAPLGLTPAKQGADDADLSGATVIDAGAERPETLYMELEKDQEPGGSAD